MTPSLQPKAVTLPPVVITGTSRQDFLNRCSEATTHVVQSGQKFSAWLSSLSVAYANAWYSHTRFLDGIDAAKRLQEDALLAFATTFLGGLAGGLAGDTMRKVASSNWIIDPHKDLTKLGTRTMLSNGASSTRKTVPPANPVAWQNKVNAIVQEEMAEVTGAIARWQGLVNNNDATFDWNFNPVEKVDAALSLSADSVTFVPLVKLEQVDTKAAQELFERGWLAGWIEHHAGATFASLSQVNWSGIIGKGVKGDIIGYGRRVGLFDVEQRVSRSVSRYVTHRNRGARII